jgi:hypothetical protein
MHASPREFVRSAEDPSTLRWRGCCFDWTIVQSGTTLATLHVTKDTFPNGNDPDVDTLRFLLDAIRVSPIYRWLYSRGSAAASTTSVGKSGSATAAPDGRSPFSFLDYCAVNIDAFDDPLLLHLDDKILLHRLLTSTRENVDKDTKHFWPEVVSWGHSQKFLAPPKRMVLFTL